MAELRIHTAWPAARCAVPPGRVQWLIAPRETAEPDQRPSCVDSVDIDGDARDVYGLLSRVRSCAEARRPD